MGHIHQHRYRHLGQRQADEVAGADAIAARQLGAPVLSSAASSTDDGSGGTILSIVYVTDSPTFTGAVGGYTTLDVGDPVQQTPSSSKHHKSTSSSVNDTSATISDVSTYPSPTPSSISSSSTFSTMTSAMVASSTSLITSASSNASPTSAGGAVAEVTASSTGQASASTVQGGMSAGG